MPSYGPFYKDNLRRLKSGSPQVLAPLNRKMTLRSLLKPQEPAMDMFKILQAIRIYLIYLMVKSISESFSQINILSKEKL